MDAGVAAGFHGFGEVQVVCPCFGPVFGWVGRGVGADERGFPVGEWAVGIVAGEGCGVVGGFITEAGAEGRAHRVIEWPRGEGEFPDVVAAFVMEMA